MDYLRKGVLVIVGLVAGFLIDTIPNLADHYLSLRICRESCPEWVSLYGFSIYFGVPLMLAITTALTRPILWKLKMVCLAVIMVITALLVAYVYRGAP